MARRRLSLFETIREYAYILLGVDRAEAESSFAHCVCNVVEGAPLQGAEQSLGVALIDEELHNTRAALEYARAAGDSDLELRLASGLGRYWWIRGYLSEGRSVLEGVLARAGGRRTAPVARALRAAAGLAWAQGDLDAAEKLGIEGLEVARDAATIDEELGIHTVLALVANNRRDFPRAIEHLERTASLGTELGLEHHVMTARMNLGTVLLESGDAAAAVLQFEGMLDFHRDRGISEGVGFALLNLGQARYRLGDYARATEEFGGARQAFGDVGFRVHVGHALQGEAASIVRLGAFEQAARLLGRAALKLEGVGASFDDFDRSLPTTRRLSRERRSATNASRGRIRRGLSTSHSKDESHQSTVLG